MARDLGEQNREDYARYKDDVKKEGKPFFPFAMLARHDHGPRRRARDHRPRGDLVLRRATASSRASSGRWYTEPADPGTTDFIPRPDWYFYFLFYLLRIFEWPETVFIATVGIPTIASSSCSALPFYDRRRERRPSRRPVAMVAAVLTDPLDGRPHLEGRDGEGGARLRARPARAGVGGGAGLRRQRRRRSQGAELFAQSGLPELPHVPRAGRREPRRARPLGDRRRRTTRRTSSGTSRTRRRSGTR